MRLLLAISLLLASGCIDAPEWPEEFPFEYRPLGFTVRSEIELDETKLEHNAAELVRLLETLSVDADATPIHVLAKPGWDDGRVGQFHPDMGITLNCFMGAWLHELLHAHEYAAGRLGSPGHEGWSENGYQATAEAFRASSMDPRKLQAVIPAGP